MTSPLLHRAHCGTFEGRDCDCEPIVHPAAVVGSPPEHRDHKPGSRSYAPLLGHGVRLNAYVTVDAGTSRPTMIGNNVLVMAHGHIGHDCLIGDGCELASGAVLGGWVELGRNVRVGLNATIRPRVKVGDHARIGAGAVVVDDVPAGETWVGNPAREISRRNIDGMWADQYETSRLIA